MVAAVVTAIFVSLTIPAVRHVREQPPSPPPPIHLAFEPATGSEAGGGDDSLDAAISPDGSDVVFVATTDGVARLWLRTLSSGRTEILPGTDGAQLPAWKWTGRVVSFFSAGRLRQISLPDGRLSDLTEAPAPGGATWLADGSLLFAPDDSGPIRRMLDGRITSATALSPGDRGHLFPMAADDGESFTYIAFRNDGRRTARLVTLAGEGELTETTGHAQAAGGILVYVRGSVLLAQQFDSEANRLTGRSIPLAPSVGVSPTGHGMFAASPRLLLFADAPQRAFDIGWMDSQTNGVTRFAEPRDYWQMRLSPDDRFAAVTVTAPLLRTLDVFLLPAAGTGTPQALTRAVAADTDPVWSPDGRTVLFRSMQSGRPALFTRRVGDLDAPDEPVTESERGDTATDWRGARLLVHAAGDGPSGRDIWMIDRETGRREPIAVDGFDDTDARWSPDGAWIAYVSDESGQQDVYARRTDGQGGRVRVSSAGGAKPRWSRDGRAIFFLRASRIMRADFRPGEPVRFEAAVPVLEVSGIRDFDVAHRSDRLAVLVPAPAGRAPAISAIADWTSLVDPRRVGDRGQ